MYKTGRAFAYLLLKESVANDVINVSLFACCEPRYRRVEASSVPLCQPASTLKADILNITYDCYSQNNNAKMATLFLFSFAVNINEQRIIAFLTEKCYLNLRSKVRTQLR